MGTVKKKFPPIFALTIGLIFSGVFSVILVYGDQVDPALKVISSSKLIDATGALNVVGEVQNKNATQTFSSVRVFGTFYGSSGMVVGESGTDTHPSDIDPGMTVPFSIYLDNTMSSIPVKDIANYTLLVTHEGFTKQYHILGNIESK